MAAIREMINGGDLFSPLKKKFSDTEDTEGPDSKAMKDHDVS
ncbi:MAG TPA: hypothetical protein VN604_06175 [Nitrospirota bacterium]|nr:hypothetical protein [Nitrospirota bacterium]